MFAKACKTLKVRQSAGRVASVLDNAAAESFNSTLEWEVLSGITFESKNQARRAVARFIDAYNDTRRSLGVRELRDEWVRAARPLRLPTPISDSSPQTTNERN